MSLFPVPYNTPVIDPKTGLLTQVWAGWFRDLFARLPITADDLAASVAGSGLAGGAGSALSVNVDGSTLEINSDALRVKDAGIAFVKMLGTDWTKDTSASGYTKLPNGIYIQWGVTGATTTGNTATVTFPAAFPNGCLQVVAGIVNNSGVATSATGQVGSGGYSTSGCSIYNRTSETQTMNWIAVGY